MGTGFAKKKKQAKMMQEQLSQMQSQMKTTEAVGTAGNGLVTITLSGEYEMKSIKIKPDCIDPEDAEGLQDLIKAAYMDAFNKLSADSPLSKMKLPPGMPGLEMLGM